MESIPIWNNLYEKKLNEILSDNPNSVYFVSACRTCKRSVAEDCPVESSEINSSTIPNTNNPLTNFLKSINVYEKLINNTVFV